jgi:hypothetical protein
MAGNYDSPQHKLGEHFMQSKSPAWDEGGVAKETICLIGNYSWGMACYWYEINNDEFVWKFGQERFVVGDEVSSVQMMRPDGTIRKPFRQHWGEYWAPIDWVRENCKKKP